MSTLLYERFEGFKYELFVKQAPVADDIAAENNNIKNYKQRMTKHAN